MRRQTLCCYVLLVGLIAMVEVSADEKGGKDAKDAKESANQLLSEALTESSSAEGLKASLYLVREQIDQTSAHGMFTYVLLVRTLVQHGLNQARDDSVDEYQRMLLPALYNLSADTWTGWDDANVHADTYQPHGLEAAELNVRLRDELGLDHERRSKAYWMLGVHQLAEGDASGALRSFKTCEALDQQVESPHGTLVSVGWQHVTAILLGKDESKKLEMIKQQLIEIDDEGVFYAGQFQPALTRLAPAYASNVTNE
ncbi:MAG: hypothetical protein AAF525_00895 [Pseudomonadota bacterium]